MERNYDNYSNSNRGRGRGGGRGSGNSNNERQPNYKEQNMQSLLDLFGKSLDRDTIWNIFKDTSFDMDRTIQQLSQLTGIKTETEDDVNDEHVKVFEKKGDLFGCQASESLAHCVSRDLRMGKGIAVEFKNRFSHVQDLINQNKKIGEVAILGPLNENRFVYYLITKENYWNKPTYDSLRATVIEMKNHALVNNVKAISMPRLGCGLDGLMWGQVKKMLKEEFKDTGIVITVYSL